MSRHPFKSRWRLFHHHHAKTLSKVGRVSIFAELGHYASELAGLHPGVTLAAIAIVFALSARILAGEL